MLSADSKKAKDPNFSTLCLASVFVLLLLCSGLLAYLACLLIPAYFTYRAFKETGNENVRNRMMKYWICYAFLSYPLKLASSLIIPNDMIIDIVQILAFSNLYHPRSQNSDAILAQLQRLVSVCDPYLKRLSQGFFEGFEAEILKK